jgi:hypothetical protein
VRPAGWLPLRCPEGGGAAARGDGAHGEARTGCEDAPRADPPTRRHHVEEDPCDHAAAHAGRPRRRPRRRRLGASLSRGRGPPPHKTRSGRGRPGAAAQQPRRRQAAGGALRRRANHPEPAGEALPRAAAPSAAAATRDQPARRRPLGRLPLARPAADRRARQLPLPPLPPRLGTRPPPRTPSPRPRRPIPPLHLDRRLRAATTNARRTANAQFCPKPPTSLHPRWSTPLP